LIGCKKSSHRKNGTVIGFGEGCSGDVGFNWSSWRWKLIVKLEMSLVGSLMGSLMRSLMENLMVSLMGSLG
jgi:hypothetical protein